MLIFFYILIHNIIPIFFLISLGYILDKKFNFDMHTLSKINFYVYVPGFAFLQTYESKIPKTMIKVALCSFILLFMNYIVGYFFSKIRKFDTSNKYTFINSLMFFNSGNIGIPLMALVFSSKPFIVNGQTPYLELAMTTQTIIFIIQSTSTNTIGLYNASHGKLSVMDSVKSVLTMPIIYAIPLAFILKVVPYDISKIPIWSSLVYIKNGMIAFVLIILGAQLSKTPFKFNNKDIYLSNIMRQLVCPLFAYIIIKSLGITGVMAETMFIASGLPTAVNTALIAVECDNNPDYASQIVMSSTLLSSITLVFIVILSRILFPI